MTSDIPRQYYTIKQAAELIGVSWPCLRDRAVTFGIIRPGVDKRVKLHREDVEKLKFIHRQIVEEGRKTWKVKELMGLH